MTLLPIAFIVLVGVLGYLASKGKAGRLGAWMQRHQMLRCQRVYFRLEGRYGVRRQCEKPEGHVGQHGLWDGSYALAHSQCTEQES